MPRLDARNARKHSDRNKQAIRQSLEAVGAGRSILLDADDNVLAGNGVLEQAEQMGIPLRVIETTGAELVAVKRTDLTGDKARQAATLDNLVADTSAFDYDAERLREALENDPISKAIAEQDERLRELLGLQVKDVSGVEKGKKPNPRKLPLDVIFTISSAPRCCVAVDAGFMYGVQSNNRVLNVEGFCKYEHTQRHKLEFIDNDYFKYDHALHSGCIKKWKPKYATVRDIMSEEQCKAAGIAWYPLEQILDWAEELSEHAKNVIVIPKYDCIDKIPEKFMLGYSIPTKHGGTPLPVSMFRGRRVHLLGGSWTMQLSFLGELKNDVVSLDNNYENIRAEYGQFTDGIGKYRQIEEIIPSKINNGLMSCLVLGLGAIGAKVNELYSKSNRLGRSLKTRLTKTGEWLNDWFFGRALYFGCAGR